MPTAAPQVYGHYGNKSKRDFYEGLLGALKSERSSFDSHWRELGDWIFPHRVQFSTSDRNKGEKKRQNIIDSTAGFAARTLQSGLHAGLTSPARPWFKLSTPDPELASHGPVKEWLHVVTQRMQAVFAQTNLYNTLPIAYGDLGTFGTGAIAMFDDTRDSFRTQAFPLGSYVLGMDARGRVTTFMREYQRTVRQVVEQFGGKNGGPAVIGQPINWTHISQATKDLWDSNNYETAVELCWVVSPNPEAGQGFGSKYFQWTSCYFERGTGTQTRKDLLLRESGFNTFPIMAPRWDLVGEDSYGRECPGMIALGDVRQLQIMERKMGQALSKIVDPPLVGPVALRTQKTSLLAGDITYVDEREGMRGLRSIHEINLNLEHMARAEMQVQGRIQRAYYEDLFLMMANRDPSMGLQPITAAEVAERHEEKLLALGPVLERTNDELLDPMIDRAYELMVEQGLIPDPPEELDNVTLKVEYVSIMAQAQKLVGVVGQDRFLQTMLPLAEQFPEVRKKIRVFQFVDNYAEMLGVDPRAIVPTDEAEAAMADEQRQVAMAQNAETAKTMAQAGQAAAQIPIGQGNTVLDQVLSGVGA